MSRIGSSDCRGELRLFLFSTVLIWVFYPIFRCYGFLVSSPWCDGRERRTVRLDWKELTVKNRHFNPVTIIDRTLIKLLDFSTTYSLRIEIRTLYLSLVRTKFSSLWLGTVPRLINVNEPSLDIQSSTKHPTVLLSHLALNKASIQSEWRGKRLTLIQWIK